MKDSKVLKQKSEKLKRKISNIPLKHVKIIKMSKNQPQEQKEPYKIKSNSINQTTIKVMRETKGRLNKLKEYERESYDQILRKMLYVLNMCRQNPEKAKNILEEISKVIKREKEFKKEDIE